VTTGNTSRLGNSGGSNCADSGDPATPVHQESIHVLNDSSGIVGVVTLPLNSVLTAESSVTADTSATTDSSLTAHVSEHIRSGSGVAGEIAQSPGQITTSDAEAGEPKPALILFNAGLLHRVGPNRLNTTLARICADDGYPSLRLDLTGLGDSPALSAGTEPQSSSNNNNVESDLSDAMNFMQQRYQVKKFILIGLCSGALDALAVAAIDKRVVAAVCIDGIAFRTPRFYVNHIFSHKMKRMLQIKNWRRLLYRVTEGETEYGQLVGGMQNSMADDGNIARYSRQRCAELLKSMDERYVRLLFIYTGGAGKYYNYAGQFREMFRGFKFSEGISSKFHPKADHLFMLESHRKALIVDIRKWLGQVGHPL